MKKTVRKKQFIQAIITNSITEDPKTNKRLASEMGITERWFYILYIAPIFLYISDPLAVSKFEVERPEDECTKPEVVVTWTQLQGKDRRGDIKSYKVTYWTEKEPGMVR